MSPQMKILLERLERRTRDSLLAKVLDGQVADPFAFEAGEETADAKHSQFDRRLR